ncbi:hypothetical protein [Terrisporobacter vanillatitrophus]|uniref:hypothetical protein n=1 Tax=Terrisporobacter vanillatitrophus TaxID=3058402 RepID=UPI003366E377
MSKKFRKGQYEEAVEQAKDLLDKNFGMTDIVSITNLTKEEVTKIMNKRQAELNDKRPDFH